MRFSGNIIKTTFLILTLIIPFNVLQGERNENIRFANQKLQELFLQLPISVLPEADTQMAMPDIIKGKEVTFTFNSKNQLSHLGISLFNDDVKDIYDEYLCNFIERFFLELLLMPDSQQVKRKLDEKEVHLSYCGQEFGEGLFNSISNILYMTDATSDFILRTGSQEGDATWRSGDKSLNLKFPMNRELIEGTDKKEADTSVCEMLKDAVSEKVIPHDDMKQPANPEKLPQGIYVSRGVVGQVQELSSDIYYLLKNGRYEFLYDERFPEYSMNNLFLTFKNGKGKSIHIIHRQYGNSEHEIILPLTNFLACFHNDFLTTCHTAYNKEGELETIVLFYHKTLNYIHMIRAHIDKEELFRTSATINADLYTNIPQHYIKTLLQ